jgi:hypothetical protein
MPTRRMRFDATQVSNLGTVSVKRRRDGDYEIFFEAAAETTADPMLGGLYTMVSSCLDSGLRFLLNTPTGTVQ